MPHLLSPISRYVSRLTQDYGSWLHSYQTIMCRSLLSAIDRVCQISMVMNVGTGKTTHIMYRKEKRRRGQDQKATFRENTL
jgi:hypothetical protein